MVVPGDFTREMPEGEILRSEEGGGGVGGGCERGGGGDGGGGGGGGVCQDDEIFLLPLTALAMEADDLRWLLLPSCLLRVNIALCIMIIASLCLTGTTSVWQEEASSYLQLLRRLSG